MSVPFPHVEQSRVVRRPALVVARRDSEAVGVLLWTLMVTNAARAPWAGDVLVPLSSNNGLRSPSKIRTAKISTTEEATAARIGRLDDATWLEVLDALRIGAPHLIAAPIRP